MVYTKYYTQNSICGTTADNTKDFISTRVHIIKFVRSAQVRWTLSINGILLEIVSLS